MLDKTCKNCGYCAVVDELAGENTMNCFRYPPTTVAMQQQNPLTQQVGIGAMALPTRVTLDHWCGEWKEAPKKLASV